MVTASSATAPRPSGRAQYLSRVGLPSPRQPEGTITAAASLRVVRPTAGATTPSESSATVRTRNEPRPCRSLVAPDSPRLAPQVPGAHNHSDGQPLAWRTIVAP